jgi:hypothetical protein
MKLTWCALVALMACGNGKAKEDAKPPAPENKTAAPAPKPVAVDLAADPRVTSTFEKVHACRWREQVDMVDDCVALVTWKDEVVTGTDPKQAQARAAYLVAQLGSPELARRRWAAKLMGTEAVDPHGPALLAALGKESDPAVAKLIAGLLGKLKPAQIGDRPALIAAFRQGSDDVKGMLAAPMGDPSCQECLAALSDALLAAGPEWHAGKLVEAYPESAIDAKLCAAIVKLAVTDERWPEVNAKAATKLGLAPACAAQLEPLIAGFEAAARSGKGSGLVKAIDTHVLVRADFPAALLARTVAATRLVADTAPTIGVRLDALDLIARHDRDAKAFLSAYKSDSPRLQLHANQLAAKL